jgi:uncharacterized membrane protein
MKVSECWHSKTEDEKTNLLTIFFTVVIGLSIFILHGNDRNIAIIFFLMALGLVVYERFFCGKPISKNNGPSKTNS